MQVNYPKMSFQNNVKKTSFKSKKDANKDYVSIRMPLPYINNFVMGLSLFHPIIDCSKNDKLSYLGIFGIGMINCFLPNNKEIIEIDKGDNKDITIKKHFLKKQGLEAIILTASSLLTAKNINDNIYTNKIEKNISIGLNIAAWGISILNNILGYKKYRDNIDCGNYK